MRKQQPRRSRTLRSAVFDDDEEEAGGIERPDRELTLGTGTLLLLFFVLVLLCGLCFGVGFSLGQRSASIPAVPRNGTTQPDSVLPAPVHADSKPSPIAAPVPATNAAPISEDLTAATPDSQASASQSSSQQTVASGQQALQQAEQIAGGAAGRSVKPALQQLPNAPMQQTASAPRAALPPENVASHFMVQVAAVSDPVDAQVLLDALRKRGYSVTLTHAATDKLMRVQVGPFSTRADALRMRQKLLQDGYNAIVK